MAKTSDQIRLGFDFSIKEGNEADDRSVVEKTVKMP
jgi:hypothetical protein